MKELGEETRKGEKVDLRYWRVLPWAVMPDYAGTSRDGARLSTERTEAGLIHLLALSLLPEVCPWGFHPAPRLCPRAQYRCEADTV